jgi:Cu2+-exporting ATPase
MDFTIRHFIPGRVRLHIPTLCRRRWLADASLSWLRGQVGIRSARINYDCACLVVEYDLAYEDQFRALVGRLRLIGVGELRRLVAPTESGDDMPAAIPGAPLQAKPSLMRRAPLALPTLALALALSANPVVRAVNCR